MRQWVIIVFPENEITGDEHKMAFRLSSRRNAPPKDADEQAIPKSLERVIRLKEAAKVNVTHRTRKRKKKNSLIQVDSTNFQHPKTRPEKVVPVLRQRPGESKQHFWHRVSRETHAFLKETAFERKYRVQVERDPVTGLIQGLTKQRKINKNNDVEKLQLLRSKHKNISKKKTTTAPQTASLSKCERRNLKQYLKKKEKVEKKDYDEFERLQDKVAFGEVAREPPKLNIKAETTSERRKPNNLLLDDLLTNKNTPNVAVGLSGKRKLLPVEERQRLEKQRNEVIAMYRQLKSQRSANTRVRG